VVDDYGLGILGPRKPQIKDTSSEIDATWQKMDIKEKISAYAATPIAVMRGVQSSDFLAIIEAMEQRQDISPYINSKSTLKIPASNLALQRDVAIQQRDVAIQQRDVAIQQRNAML